MLHGFGTTGDMWAPLAAAFVTDHSVLVPDLRGLGCSSKPAGGYDKLTQAADLLGRNGLARRTGGLHLVSHDIGNMVAYAFAAQHPERVDRFVPIDAPLPGIEPWGEIQKDPSMWQFGFGGPDMERLVEGRERIYLDRFWNEFSHDPKRFDGRNVNTMPRYMRCLVLCVRVSRNFAPLLVTPQTTRRFWPAVGSKCPCWPLAASFRSDR